MGNPAAVMWDMIIGTDNHVIITSSGSSITALLPFNGVIDGNCSTDVLICGKPAAFQGSTADNIPPHIPVGGSFATPPDNKAEITSGSGTVLINNKPAARLNDSAKSCDDAGGGNSKVQGSAGSVLIG